MGRRLQIGGLGFSLQGGMLSRITKRREYVQLKRGGSSSGKKVKILKLHGPDKGKKGWRIKLIPKLCIRFLSPVKLLRKLRDAYINMMNAAASRGNLSALVMGSHGVAGPIYPGRRTKAVDLDQQYLECLKRALQHGKILFP